MTAVSPTPASTQTLDQWAATLSFLEHEVMPGVDGMVRRLDLVMGDRGAQTTGDDEPNGYSGLSRRGDLRRMLLSDWLLSDAEPDEFLRRLSMSEISYLEIERSSNRLPGQIAILMDGGPNQHGPGRLAQLAGLIVLERRARAHGVPLAIGNLTDTDAQWTRGALPELFETWLKYRSHDAPTQDDLDRWAERIEPASHVWVFGAHDLALGANGSSWDRLTADIDGWDSAGATSVVAQASGRSATLDIPDSATAKRILRGRGIVRAPSTVADAPKGSLRFPGFRTSRRFLLCRTEHRRELAAVPIPATRAEPMRRIKRYSFSGNVLAAAILGRRTLALTQTGDWLRVEVIGKKLDAASNIRVALTDLALSKEDCYSLAESELGDLYFTGTEIVVKLGGSWIRLNGDSAKADPQLVAASHTKTMKNPRFVYDAQGQEIFIGAEVTAELVEPGRWSLSSSESEPDVVGVDGTVVGVANLEDGPRLVVHTPGGQIIRLVGAQGESTLTKFSGDVRSVVVHPTLPIAAIERSDRIDLVDLDRREHLARVRGDKAK